MKTNNLFPKNSEKYIKHVQSSGSVFISFSKKIVGNETSKRYFISFRCGCGDVITTRISSFSIQQAKCFLCAQKTNRLDMDHYKKELKIIEDCNSVFQGDYYRKSRYRYCKIKCKCGIVFERNLYTIKM